MNTKLQKRKSLLYKINAIFLKLLRHDFKTYFFNETLR